MSLDILKKALLIFFMLGFGFLIYRTIFYVPERNIPETAMVKHVIDGDTIELENGRKVRYIGINAPEIYYPDGQNECFALESRKANMRLVEGKTILLVKDISGTDKYGRLLRYVYVSDPKSNMELFVNKILLSEGYARLMAIPPDLAYYRDFKNEQVKAQNANKGLWNACRND